MADTKTTALTELASGAVDDLDVSLVTDVSDATQGASGTLKKFKWSSIKATLKTYFDTLYQYAPIPTGAAGDLSTDDTTFVNTALAALTPHEVLRLPARYAVTSFDNALGAEFEGPGFARLASGALRGIKALRPGRLSFGAELLHVFHKRLYDGLAHTVVMSGDSTTSGFDNTLLPKIAAHLKLSVCTFTNRGQDGKSTADWVSTYLSGDISGTVHLLILRWGINDPYYSRTAAQAIASLRSGLATVRSTSGKDLKGLSILICTPTVTSDPATGRDEKYHEEIANGFRQAAIDYDCAFLDLYSMFPNARGGAYATGNSAAQLWMDDPYTNGSAIHPGDMHDFRIAQAIADFIYAPLAIKGYYAGEQVFADCIPTGTRMASTADAASTFPYGQSMYRCSNGPVDGWLVVFRHQDGGCTQINIGYNGEKYMSVRHQNGGSWTAWYKLGDSGVSNIATAATGYTQPGSEQLTAFSDGLPNGTVMVDGYVGMNSAAQLTAGTTFATVTPAPAAGKAFVSIFVWNGAWELVPGEVTQAGALKALANSVQTNVQRVYVSGVYRKA